MADKAVEYHRAEPALSGKAASLRPEEPEIYTQYIDQPPACFALDYNIFAVQNEAYGQEGYLLTLRFSRLRFKRGTSLHFVSVG